MTEAFQLDQSGGTAPGAPCSPGLSLAVGRAMGTVVVTLHGTVDAAAASVLECVLRDLIDEQGNLDVVVDLRRVVISDPAGHAVLVQASAWADRHGGRLTLCRSPIRRRRGGGTAGLGRPPQPAVPDSESSGRRWTTGTGAASKGDPIRVTAVPSSSSHMEATSATPA